MLIRNKNVALSVFVLKVLVLFGWIKFSVKVTKAAYNTVFTGTGVNTTANTQKMLELYVVIH